MQRKFYPEKCDELCFFLSFQRLTILLDAPKNCFRNFSAIFTPKLAPKLKQQTFVY
jgi:hypothetical protein